MVDRSDKNNNGTPEWPDVKEKHWLTLAITFAIFTIIFFAISFLAIFLDGIQQHDLLTVQMLSPFGVAMFALVTFFTVNWRGLITTRQADVAARQIALAERESRAKLLQEGAKLLGEDGKQSHVSAGIATLGILITGDDDLFATQAMNLVADFIQRSMGDGQKSEHKSEAFDILAAGERLGRSADRRVQFHTNDDRHEWSLIKGVWAASYVGGSLDNFPGDSQRLGRAYSFRRMSIEWFENIEIDGSFIGCTIRHCSIAKFSFMFSSADELDKNTFEFCNFSRTAFSQRKYVEDFRDGKNYYEEGKVPSVIRGTAIEDWQDFLLEQKTTSIPRTRPVA